MSRSRVYVGHDDFTKEEREQLKLDASSHQKAQALEGKYIYFPKAGTLFKPPISGDVSDAREESVTSLSSSRSILSSSSNHS